MSTFINRFFLFIASTLLLASAAHSQIRRGPQDRIDYLENRVQQLEYMLPQLNQRLAALEARNRPQPHPGSPSREMTCMIEDTLIYKVFLAKGRTLMEAEANVRQACGARMHSSYCQAKLKCSGDRDYEVRQGVLCMLNDTLISRTYKGEGKSFIEAEYNARLACTEKTHGSFCRSAVRCEAF